MAQVVKISSANAATASVSQPPSWILRLLATTKPRSTAAKASTPSTTATRFQCHSLKATTPASSVVVTIVTETAMP